MKLVNSAKIIMDVDFIYVYKSKTYFWKSLVGPSPTSPNARPTAEEDVLVYGFVCS